MAIKIKRILPFWARRSLRVDAASELEQMATHFEGLYEPVYLLSKGKQANQAAFDSWETRAKALRPNGALVHYLQGLPKQSRRRAKRLLRCIIMAEICREELGDDGWITIYGIQAGAYRALDGHELVDGERVHVLSPAWYRMDSIVEHGMAGEFI